MNDHNELEVFLVEDNPRDAELTLRALRKRNPANHVTHVKDGREALDWLNDTGAYADRDPKNQPRISRGLEAAAGGRPRSAARHSRG